MSTTDRPDARDERGTSTHLQAARIGSTQVWALVRGCSGVVSGHVVLRVGRRVHVLATGYVEHEATIYFRTPVFGTLARRVETGVVTLQIDHVAGNGPPWSVVLTGRAHRVHDAPTVAMLWSPQRPPAQAGVQELWVALVPDGVHGWHRAS